MPTTKGRWGSKVIQSLLLENSKDEKHHSSSTFLRTQTMVISMSLWYSWKEWMRTWNAWIVFQMWINWLKSNSNYMVIWNCFSYTTWTSLVVHQTPNDKAIGNQQGTWSLLCKLHKKINILLTKDKCSTLLACSKD
jgi:hypothetical protein